MQFFNWSQYFLERLFFIAQAIILREFRGRKMMTSDVWMDKAVALALHKLKPT
jgi:hypothetical protein